MTNINANKINDFEDILNRAMEIHAQKAIQGLPFNKTELAEIVDITNRDLGRYVVWNGSAKYEAISENTAYKMGMKVYVNIPNNDFTGQKTIIGQYRQDGEKAVFYKSPLEMYEPSGVDLVKDTVYASNTNGADEFGLLADRTEAGNANSDPGAQTITIFKAAGLQDSPYNGYKYMGISADFKTLIGGYHPTGGDYGLRVIVKYIQELEVTEDTTIQEKIFTLSAVKDMFGAIYNFKTYFPQEALYNVENLTIDSIEVQFYQDGYFVDGNQTPFTYDTGGMVIDEFPNNILVKNLSIVFGNDPINENDQVKIYTLNGTTYDSAQKESLNQKTIKLQWTHLNPDTNEHSVMQSSSDAKKISDLTPYEIHWYRDSIYKVDQYATNIDPEIVKEEDEVEPDGYSELYNAVVNAQGEASQEDISKFISTFKLKPSVHYTIMGGEYSIQDTGYDYARGQIQSATRTAAANKAKATDTLAGAFWTADNYSQSLDQWQWDDFLPDLKRSLSKVKVVIVYGEGDNRVQIESNELVFNNLREVLADDKSNSLSIEFVDKTDGCYPIYNSTDGKLLSRLEANDRYLKANFVDSAGVSALNGNEAIIWKIPRTNTMIQMVDIWLTMEHGVLLRPDDEIFTTWAKDIGAYDNHYYYVKRESINGKPTQAVSNMQTYRIAEYFNKSNTNNTVSCYIIKNNEIFIQSVTMQFNQHGTSGTDYTLTLGLGNKVVEDSETHEWIVVGAPDTALTIGEITEKGQPVYNEIVFDLFNSKNEKIELTDEQRNAIISKWRVENVTGGGYYRTTQASKNNLQYIEYIKDNKAIRYAIRAPYDNPKDPDKPFQVSSFDNITFQAQFTSKVEEDNLGNVEFTQLMPLHVRAKGTNWVLNGSDYIVYDDKGANPQFYNDTYELVNPDTGEVLQQYLWLSSDGDNNNNFKPKISNGKLVPSPIYVEDIENIWLTWSLGNHSDGSGVYSDWQYTFPLIIIQNKYSIPALNKWNGELVVDAEGNKILASMIGAGHKNDDNTFSGVVMGDVIQKNEHTGENEEMTGLFGYDGGAQAFGFNTDGKAFIGKANTGRIYVDGNTGRITSAAREAYDINIERGVQDTDPRGMDINLKENYIDIQGDNNSKSKIHIDTVSDDARGIGPYFSIDNIDGNRLLHIGNDEYYLQDNKRASGEKGLKIDLKNGVFDSTGKLTIVGDSNSSIKFGNTFKVDGSGEVTLGSLTFVDTDGRIKTEGDNGQGRNATGIHPKWMTFVTDVEGAILKSHVDIDVNVAVTVNGQVPYSYEVYKQGSLSGTIGENTYALEGDPHGVAPQTYIKTSDNLTIGSWTIVGSPTIVDNDLDTGRNWLRYSWEAPVTITGAVTGTETKQVDVSYSGTGSGKGTSQVPTVESIKLKITKLSMWALTNNDTVVSTAEIPTYGAYPGGTYPAENGNIETIPATAQKDGPEVRKARETYNNWGN